jgi:hypothetical protein
VSSRRSASVRDATASRRLCRPACPRPARVWNSIRTEPPYTVGRATPTRIRRRRAQTGALRLASHSRTDWQERRPRSCRPPQPGRRTLPPKRGGEQGGQQLDRLRFLGSCERLEPHRPKPDLTVIAIGVGRSGSTLPPPRGALGSANQFWTRRRGAKKINDPPAQTDTPGRTAAEENIPQYRYALFGALLLHVAAKTYETFTAVSGESAACQWRVSAVSVRRRRIPSPSDRRGPSACLSQASVVLSFRLSCHPLALGLGGFAVEGDCAHVLSQSLAILVGDLLLSDGLGRRIWFAPIRLRLRGSPWHVFDASDGSGSA